MFQKSIFIKTILLLNIILLFKIYSSIIFAQDIVPYIRPDIEKKWLSSIDITYKGLISKEIQNRYIGSSLTFGYIFNRNFSIYFMTPFDFRYTFYPNEVPDGKEKTETLFLVGNALVLPEYKFKFMSDYIYCLLGMQIPIDKKISGNMSYEEHSIFSLQPGIGIEKIEDPIITKIQLVINKPFWEKDNKDDLSDLWWAQLVSSLYFIINEKFSFFTNFAILVQKQKENYIFEPGVAYLIKPFKELRFYLSINYDNIMYDSSIGSSYILMFK